MAAEENVKTFEVKIQELVKLASTKKNVLEYKEIENHFKDQELEPEKIEAIYEFLEKSGIDVLGKIEEEEEEEENIKKLDLSLPEGLNIDDPVRMYLKEIGKVSLLTAEEEVKLAKRMEEGDEIAKQRLAEANLRLIRQAITRAIADQARTIRIPVHMVETINKLIRVSRQLLQELGRDPTPEEIGEELDMPVEKVREILKISQEPVSLETPIGEEEDSHLGDFIQDDNVPVPAEAAAFTLLKEQLVEVLDTLTDREQKVLRLRFGLDDGRARTLEEVGKEFNVTRERIRQIEAKALRKLRHPSRSRKLKDYLE